jgi:DNA-binding NarL/FixJ family response regulator
MCKVLIADDHDVMRTAIRKLLQEENNIDIVGEASTFAQTVQMIGDFKPDVLLLERPNEYCSARVTRSDRA